MPKPDVPTDLIDLRGGALTDKPSLVVEHRRVKVVVGGDGLLQAGERAAALDHVRLQMPLICGHLHHRWIALRMGAVCRWELSTGVADGRR